MERIELIRDLNNKVLRCLNQWSSETLDGTYFNFSEYSDFCCLANKRGQQINMNQKEMQEVFDFFTKHFSQYKIGIAITESEIYLGTAHLSTNTLEDLYKTPIL